MNKNNTLYNTAINFSLVLCMSVEPMACAESWRDFVNPESGGRANYTHVICVKTKGVYFDANQPRDGGRFDGRSRRNDSDRSEQGIRLAFIN